MQSRNGKGFEYACIKVFKEYLENKNNIIQVLDTESTRTAKDDYYRLSKELQLKMDKAAKSAVKVIAKLEPLLLYSKGDKLYLTLQADKKGITGDVRDLIAIRKEEEWEIGISCKHNHSAVKHSRLSKQLDFGTKWLDIPCSDTYFEEIRPIFERLEELKSASIKWRVIPHKSETIYIPILNSFIKELNRLEKENPAVVPQRFLSYLLGSNDFYKVISKDSKKITQILAFNMYGTLNKNYGKIKPQVKIPQLILPTKFYDISFKEKSQNTIIASCDNGWSVSMRIHSASTLVESSLKFDVNLIGIPSGLYTHYEPWE